MRLMKIVKNAHFRLIVGAGRDLDRARLAKLAITRIAVAQRRERRTHTCVVADRRGLAMEETRKLRTAWDIRETNAALLESFGANRGGPRVGGVKIGEEDGV